jgi:hypothetical protein
MSFFSCFKERFMGIIEFMEGKPVVEIAQLLGISSDAVKKRFQKKEIKPFRYIGSAGLYRESDIDLIREAPRGRPRPKAVPETHPKTRQPAAKPKAKKPKKN